MLKNQENGGFKFLSINVLAFLSNIVKYFQT